MKFLISIVFIFLLSCTETQQLDISHSTWNSIKESSYVDLFLEKVFKDPYALSNSTLGWEDGVYITRDGLELYCTYLPVDMLGFVLSGDTVEELSNYYRGPDYGMDFDSNPMGNNEKWIHSDILVSTRESTNEEFGEWQLSEISRGIYSEGGYCRLDNFDGSQTNLSIITSNEDYESKNNFKVFYSFENAINWGAFLTETDQTGTELVNSRFDEDNPHLDKSEEKLILFFDSKDRPGGKGDIDIWYSISEDLGKNWTTPKNLTSVNSNGKEHQPHLYFDGTDWWLYYSADHDDYRLSIYRRKLLDIANWDSWGSAELVIGPGNCLGVGEPTLTSEGDLSFVVIYENRENGAFDRYDADAWYAEAKH